MNGRAARGLALAVVTVAAGSSGAALFAGCYPTPPDPAKTGTAPSTEDLDLSFADVPDGPPSLVGASGLTVKTGLLQLAGGAGSGATSLPINLPAGARDSTVVVTATVPFGANLVVARGRVRGGNAQAALGVIFAPQTAATIPRPSGFLIAIGVGQWTDPKDSVDRDLGCGGSPSGQTAVLRWAGGRQVATPGIIAEGAILNLFKAPQLANLSDETKAGAVTTKQLSEEASEYTVEYKATGDGTGTVRAVQGSVDLFDGAYAVDKGKVAGTSMACKLSYTACVEACAGGLGLIAFGADCTAESCATNSVVSATNAAPQPVDFQSGETCRQTSEALESCNVPLNADAPTAVAYRVATNETFKASTESNQFILQLVRGSDGQSPTVSRIRVTR